ncbi:hypothetical protein HYU16_04895 [Candidatus Woesearchaeota archaeon]|nr:hypothetical protein [Candidatus Woesearchaeota archaeon]
MEKGKLQSLLILLALPLIAANAITTVLWNYSSPIDSRFLFLAYAYPFFIPLVFFLIFVFLIQSPYGKGSQAIILKAGIGIFLLYLLFNLMLQLGVLSYDNIIVYLLTLITSDVFLALLALFFFMKTRR